MLSKNQRQFFEEIRRSSEISQRRLDRMEKQLQEILARLTELKPIHRILREMGFEHELDQLIVNDTVTKP